MIEKYCNSFKGLHVAKVYGHNVFLLQSLVNHISSDASF